MDIAEHKLKVFFLIFTESHKAMSIIYANSISSVLFLHCSIEILIINIMVAVCGNGKIQHHRVLKE
jgi:hypothetical protein